ncbi:phosphoglycerate mutase family protein-like protein [Amniculicola lignicola CBS 123094]|uniref:Phosphoglycerate mutase family protein-like protein n=1 Tax=Amniculicola lignicola CBS 123094 TaxID=1392246 RepID=A0A6A5WU93_9PLEO|nr:phosphoglycerate mutase family protein-like protein [Amniculicola lignicola CBS 123094]
MPPRLYLVRHAEGEHNATVTCILVNPLCHIDPPQRNFQFRDLILTSKGQSQCATLRSTFPYHDEIDLVLSSPQRRAIQTAVLSFGPILARNEVKYMALPLAQEVSDMGCDTGFPKDELEALIPGLFEGSDLRFDVEKIVRGVDGVPKGWNVKTGYYAYTREAISQRASDLRSWLFQRSEDKIILVTHGAFLHFLTEDWDVDDPLSGTAYNHCEVRIFDFKETSTAKEAHLIETKESKETRGANEKEKDEHVLEELTAIVK